MVTKKRTISDAGVSRETLEETPARTLQFLIGVGKSPVARALLAQRGYDDREHKRGWVLLEAAGNRSTELSFTDDEISSAETALDQWDEPTLRLIRAGLTRHPQQRDQVLKGLTAATGAAAVLNAVTILQRLDELESTAEGRAALETLSRRGLDKEERKRVAALVKTAKTGSTNGVTAEQLAAEEEQYDQALLELRDWFDEWSEIAKLNIKRRDLLIRLGLAERRTSAATDNVVDPSPFITDPAKPDPTKG